MIETQNGVNVIILNQEEEILVVKHNYGQNLWGLPGGKIERGETPRQRARTEVMEETGFTIFEAKLTLFAQGVQRCGLVNLYETDYFEGEMNKTKTKEIELVEFMSLQKIIERRNEFGIAYIRMLIAYSRCKHGLDNRPVEFVLFNRIEYPHGLDIEFEGVLLQV